MDISAIKGRLDAYNIARSEDSPAQHDLLKLLLDSDVPDLMQTVLNLREVNAMLIEYARGWCHTCRYHRDGAPPLCEDCLNGDRQNWKGVWE